MAEMQKDEYKFPDEIEDKDKPEGDSEFEIEIEDDLPPEDRNKEPMPKELVKKLEEDELDQYEGETKEKLKQLKKVWHDERRDKESAQREQQEAISLANKVLAENKALKAKINSGEKMLVSSFKESVQNETDLAKREYREAYESGDTDKIIEAQEKLTLAKIRADRISNYQPVEEQPLQEAENVVQREQSVRTQPDRRAAAWQERNNWFGQDEEMTSLALGLHEKLKRNGVNIGSDEYYDNIDKTIRRRFPESFEDEETEKAAKDEEPQKSSRSKASTVVAPATRSTSPKKIRLTTSQVQIAKKLGLTPEQYAREITKLEAQNG